MSLPVAVELRLPRAALRRWHGDLAAALEAGGARVSITWTDDELPSITGLTRLMGLERRLHGLSAGSSRPLLEAHLARYLTPGAFEDGGVRMDLGGSAGPPRGWTLRFDGQPGEHALATALLSGRFPVVEVVGSEGSVVAAGRPGSERPGVTAAAIDDVLAGCVTLILAGLRGHRLRLPDSENSRLPERSPRSPAGQALRAVGGVGLRRAARLALRTPHWRVGWRYVDDAPTLSTLRHPPSGWTVLPDDGHHFYADPFPLIVGGRPFLFVEDFDHRVGRAVISAVEFGPHGPLGTPVPVLTHDVHLSYPFVLEEDGEIWMIPETSAAGTVELYRATSFPHRWVRHAVLLRDIDANDVTPFRHQGRWWLSASVRSGGSCSDALHLWHSDTIHGPWQAHERNPVVVDIASARPAGRVESCAGRLLRPAQDGRAGYGSALTVVEIVELDPGRYEQRVVGRIGPGEGWPGSRLHTVNRAGDLEVVDGSARSLRVPVGRIRSRVLGRP